MFKIFIAPLLIFVLRCPLASLLLRYPTSDQLTLLPFPLFAIEIPY